MRVVTGAPTVTRVSEGGVADMHDLQVTVSATRGSSRLVALVFYGPGSAGRFVANSDGVFAPVTAKNVVFLSNAPSQRGVARRAGSQLAAQQRVG